MPRIFFEAKASSARAFVRIQQIGKGAECRFWGFEGEFPNVNLGREQPVGNGFQQGIWRDFRDRDFEIRLRVRVFLVHRRDYTRPFSTGFSNLKFPGILD